MNKTEEYILETLGECEILAQLAEEAAELAKAALKLRRVLDGNNPTPVSEEEALQNLIEEVGDVWVCLDLILDEEEQESAWEISLLKMDKWAKRLEKGVERNGNVQQDPEELLGNG